ncbi:MAG: MtrB/PioB family decaheme-associated outer membrane protein [Elusimicrobia bacterium]|nr:MtrB/PioB family decaheme-associated outer membrane protein [Elusimicrobiota bacterium]
MSTRHLNKFLIPAGYLLTAALPAWGMESSGSVEFGGQAIRGDDASSKFEEYIDVPRGLYVGNFNVDTRTDAGYLKIEGSKPGFKDQKIEIESGQWGLHKLSLVYDQIPHNYSNTARSLLRDDGNGNFSLPDRMQWDLQQSTGTVDISTSNANAFLSHAPVVPLRADRSKAEISYAYNPAGRWRMSMGYSGERKVGSKAIGVTPDGSNFQEVLEPVDYQTHGFNVASEYAGKDLGFRMGYELASFQNNIKALTVDNAFRLSDGSLSSSGSSAPGQMRLALPPNNLSHQLNMALTSKLTATSRVEAALGLGLLRQNAQFLPFTVNSVIANDPRLPALPAQSLDGQVRTLNGSAKWMWKPPVKGLGVNLKGRYYDVDNKTPRLLVDQYIRYDNSLSTSAPTNTFNPTRSRRSMPIEYAKTNLGADFSYAIIRPVSVNVGYERERYKRHLREAETTNEDIYTASFNLFPQGRVTLRPLYQYARKSVPHYSAHEVAEAAYPLGEGTALVKGQMEELRKFDEVGRKRHNASLRADWDAMESVAVGLDAGLLNDDYDTEYGALDSKSNYYSADLNWSPWQRLTVYGDYTLEQITTRTRSRYRTSTSNLASNDWLGKLQDTAHTAGLGGTLGIMEKLDADLGLSMSYAKGIQLAWNPDPSRVASAEAIYFPNTYNRTSKARGALRYRWSNALSVKLGYEFWQYAETDWAQDDLEVYQATVNQSIFLDQTQPRYKAHLVSLGLTYTLF